MSAAPKEVETKVKEKFATVEEVKALHGRLEDHVVEVKRELLSLQAITKKIHSFMNGHSETGFIFLGISEDSQHTIDLTPGFQLDFDDKKPFAISDSEGAVKDKQKNIKISTMDDYKSRVISYLKSNTIGCVKEHIDEIVKFRKLDSEDGNGFIVIIEIDHSPYRPLQFGQDCKFYMRYRESEKGKGDAESKPMLAGELGHEQQEKYKRMIKINPKMVAYHHQAIPAVPELAALFDLIYYGNEELVENCLHGFSALTQMTDSFGNNALHLAVLYKRNEMVSKLIDKYKMSIYQSNGEGWTPLLSAIYVGNLDALKIFLKKDIHLIRQRDRLGNNAILLAASYGRKEIIEWFQSKDAKHLDQSELQLSTLNNEGWNALFQAVYFNNLEMVTFLFERDSKLLRGKDRHGNDAIKVAQFYKASPELIQFLSEKINVANPMVGWMHPNSSSSSINSVEDSAKKEERSRSPSPTGL